MFKINCEKGCQTPEHLGYEKLTEEMLEKYVAWIYVYDDGWAKKNTNKNRYRVFNIE